MMDSLPQTHGPDPNQRGRNSCLLVAVISLVSCMTAILLLVFSVTINIVLVMTAFPLLIGSFVVTRLLLVVKFGGDYDCAVQVKLYLRFWIYVSITGIELFLVAPILQMMAKYLTHVVYRGTTLKDFLAISLVAYGIFMLNGMVSVLVYKFVPQIPLNHSESRLNVPENVMEIIDCLILWWVVNEILKRVPDLKQDKLVGMYTYQWTKMALLVLIAYNIIVLGTRLVVRMYILIIEKLAPNEKSQRYSFLAKMALVRYVSYCANGIKHSIDFILISVMLLVTWVLYVRPHLNDTHRVKKAFEIVTLTLASLVVCAILWLIKTCLLLALKVRLIYERFEGGIIEAATQLYFLGIVGRHTHDILYLRYDSHNNNANLDRILVLKRIVFQIYSDATGFYSRSRSSTDSLDAWEGGETSQRLSNQRKRLLRAELLLNLRPSLYDLEQAAHHFLQARDLLATHHYTSDILHKFNTFNDTTIETQLRQLVTQAPPDEHDPDWELLQDQMHRYPPIVTELTLELLDAWLERTRNRCLVVANKLANAYDVVTCLNNIMSWLIIGATVMLWLILTGFATTQVVVFITSPFLAATFIFGDTCKTLFQGFIFAHVVHPIELCDLCVIAGDMMEVTKVGVWVTTFLKISTQEVLIYPNSVLSTQTIINHKTRFDWNDRIELEVPSSLDDKTIKELKNDVEAFFIDDEGSSTANFVRVLRAGSNIKIDVAFRHKEDMENTTRTYSQCYNEKCRRHYEAVDYLQCLVNSKATPGDKSNVT